MINQAFYSATPTKLDLNGPYMSFTTLPSGISGNPGDTVVLTGIATAGFIGAGATTINDGIVLYRWYEVGVGPLSDGNRLSGTSTNSLTISNLQSPGDSNRKFYLEAKYQSTAYKNRADGKNGNHITPGLSDPAAAAVTRPLPTASINASSTNISYNGSVTVSWNSTNANTLTSNFGTTALSGSQTFTNQTSSRTFRVTATNETGSANASVSVNVAAAPPPPPPPPSAPSISLSASSNSIQNGGSVTLTWSTSNATSLTSNFGVTALNGSTVVSNLIQTKTFEVTATGPGGTRTASTTVNVAAPAPSIVITSQPSPVSATFNRCSNSGGSVNFSVGTSVNNPTGATLQYQWYLNGSALSNGTNVSGAQSSTLTLKVLESQSGNNNVYVRVSYSGASTVQSNTTSYSVTVTEPRPTITQTPGDPLDQTIFVGETATFNIRASASDGRALNYQWTNNGRPFVDGTNTSSFPFGTISGATTPTLRYTANSTSASGIIYAIITDPSSTCTASNSPFQSESASFTVNNVPQKLIRVASRGDNSTSISYQDVNLNSFSFGSSGSFEFYSPFEDIQVDIRMSGGAGSGNGSYSGGQGGVAVVRLTLRKNTEYIIRTVAARGNSGANCVLYEQARLLAVSGGGGGAGTAGNGGRGGGAGVSGENGQGSNAGRGGNRGPASLGYFPGGDPYCQTITNGSIFGGLISSCTIGGETCTSAPQFWRINFAPCSAYGNSALNAVGSPVSGAALISRGFKGGIGHRDNGAIAASSSEGSGGNGCEGGFAGLPGSRAGGGGGGGFSGGVSVVSTSLGGNFGSAQFTIGLPGRV